MKRLILMRHAKSDWKAGLSDHARPLNPRGRRSAPLMGAYIAEQGLTPDHAMVSTAVRAQETWALTGLDAPVTDLAALYHAEPETILAAVRSAPEGTGTLMIVGHQPGMQEAANMFLPGWEIDHWPTAKLAVIGFTADWADLDWESGRLLQEMAPKQLEQSGAATG